MTGPDLSPETLGDLDKSNLNMTHCLGMINMQYDPLSHNTQITISVRTAVNNLVHQKLGWDDPLPGEIQNHW